MCQALRRGGVDMGIHPRTWKGPLQMAPARQADAPIGPWMTPARSSEWIFLFE